MRRRGGWAVLAAWGLAACAVPAPVDPGSRVTRAALGLETDPAVRAELAEVEAARARERGEVLLDELELRLRGQQDDDRSLRLSARLPLRRPAELAALRRARRSETEAALARLEETALTRHSRACLLAVDAATHRESAAAFEAYASRALGLLEWNREWRRSGRLSELDALRFELASRVKLAEREPGPAPPSGPSTFESALPAIPQPRTPDAFLDTDLGGLTRTIRSHQPSLALHAANAERLQALADRAKGRGRPSLGFVELSYEPVSPRRDDHEVAAQVTLDVPFGVERAAQAERLGSMRRAEELRGRQALLEHIDQGLRSLRELDHFERRAGRWRELRALADQAEAVADRWWKDRLVKPSDVDSLLDQVHSARMGLLEARHTAALAGCTLRAATGVSAADWPRRPGNAP